MSERENGSLEEVVGLSRIFATVEGLRLVHDRQFKPYPKDTIDDAKNVLNGNPEGTPSSFVRLKEDLDFLHRFVGFDLTEGGFEQVNSQDSPR